MPDLAPPEDTEDLLFDPDQHRTSFLNRIALPRLSPGPKRDVKGIQNTFSKDGEHKDIYDPSSAPLGRRSSRPVVPELQTPSATAREESEKRERLRLCEPCAAERRQGHAARKRAYSARPPGADSPRASMHRRSAPEIGNAPEDVSRSPLTAQDLMQFNLNAALPLTKPLNPNAVLPDIASPLGSPRSSLGDERLSKHSESFSEGLNDPAFWRELELRWILNLSMAFRDNSEREKFFITYAEQPNRWRRVTVSVDYREKPPDSLEADLKTLPFQRDKSAHIYEAIHESLAKVQFYDTVTNLKLETSEGRLHVHVTEDKNEIIQYPSVSAIAHMDQGDLPKVTESDLHFQSHLSGFVYRVSVGGTSYIKKEIPGPDMIDEFLYEVNALWNLRDSKHVISFCAIVLDDNQAFIKGLLISFADRGTLVDVIYDNRDPPLPWTKRDKWAKQIVGGLADIHEHGFVQGDFTLSNIVIDSEDNARIIDINRRGCPVGWEPPEFQGLIDSDQRISMYIGTKSDLYQLGMVLWALAVLDDEPERSLEALTLEGTSSGAPEYLVKWVKSCLSHNPKHRLSAKDLLFNPMELDKIQISTVMLPEFVEYPPSMPDVMDGVGLGNNGWGQNGESGHARNTPALEHDSQSMNRDMFAPEETSFAHGKEPPEYPSRQQPQQSRFNPPLHQDSGLGGVDHSTHPAAPLHQDSGLGALEDVSHMGQLAHHDSGFDEDILAGVSGSLNHEATANFSTRRGGPHDISFSGAQFR